MVAAIPVDAGEEGGRNGVCRPAAARELVVDRGGEVWPVDAKRVGGGQETGDGGDSSGECQRREEEAAPA